MTLMMPIFSATGFNVKGISLSASTDQKTGSVIIKGFMKGKFHPLFNSVSPMEFLIKGSAL